VAEFGAKKLNEAPVVPRDRAEYASPSFGAKVYDFYGEQPWWIDRNPSATGRDAGSGKFGNVHRTSDLIGMKIENSSGEDLGKVQNVMVDLPDGRVGYVMLSPRAAGRGGDLIAFPPMAITMGSNDRTLVTGLSADKLQSAPRVSRDDLDKLDDVSFANEVYRFYGKDVWWRGATGRE
jgi:sporulation protein YlmC with PRC-barrel domain